MAGEAGTEGVQTIVEEPIEIIEEIFSLDNTMFLVACGLGIAAGAVIAYLWFIRQRQINAPSIVPDAFVQALQGSAPEPSADDVPEPPAATNDTPQLPASLYGEMSGGFGG